MILGDYETRPINAGESVAFVTVNRGRLKCRSCGREFEYSQEDLREFPLPERDPDPLSP
jgi:hypothetical protein